MFCIRTCEDKRKYAYEKAIEAYWKHVDRYHTWMNYYALFNGALFVGFCTLLTATTKILEKCEDSSVIICLENDYGFLQIVLCVIGLISAITWRFSIQGHEKWEANWMNIITFYENVGVYSILIMNQEDIIGLKNENNHVLSTSEKINAYSTHKITKIFVFTAIMGWVICLLYILFKDYINDCIIYISIAICILYIVVVWLVMFLPKKWFCSDVKGKYWINKNRILWIITHCQI